MPLWLQRLKQKYHKLLSKFAFDVNLRRYPLGGSNGNILLWKRKAEMYLTSSGIDYTIIHPGG